jgi:hypothetical protein
MKLGRKMIVLTATLALLLVAAVPVLAAPRVETVDINVENRTSADVQLTLNGPNEPTTVFVGAGQVVTLEVEPGQYMFKYQACGHQNSGFFAASAGEPTLILKKCAGVALSNIVIQNNTGDPFIVTLNGTGGLYGFWVPPGGLTFQVPAGGYQFNSNACGDGSGVLKASASLNQPLIWTWDCDGDEPTLAASAD